MSLRGGSFWRCGMISLRYNERGQLRSCVHTQIEVVPRWTVSGSDLEEYIYVLTQVDRPRAFSTFSYICTVTWIRLCLSVCIKMVTASNLEAIFWKVEQPKTIYLAALKMYKGASLLIGSAVEQSSVLLSNKFLYSTNKSRCLLVPSLSLFSLSLFLPPPLLFPVVARRPRYAPPTLALLSAAIPLHK